MDYSEETMGLNNPIITYLSEKIYLQRTLIEWLLSYRLEEQHRYTIQYVQNTLRRGELHFAATAVKPTNDVLDQIKEAANTLQSLISERASHLGSNLSEKIFVQESNEFVQNGNRWTRKEHQTFG